MGVSFGPQTKSMTNYVQYPYFLLAYYRVSKDPPYYKDWAPSRTMHAHRHIISWLRGIAFITKNSPSYSWTSKCLRYSSYG